MRLSYCWCGRSAFSQSSWWCFWQTSHCDVFGDGDGDVFDKHLIVQQTAHSLWMVVRVRTQTQIKKNTKLSCETKIMWNVIQIQSTWNLHRSMRDYLSVSVFLQWTKHHSSKQHHGLFHIEHCSTTIATFGSNNTIAEKTATKHNSTISTNSSISTLTENQTPLCSPTFLFMCGPLVALVAWTPHYTQTQQLHIYQRLHFGLGTL